MLAFVRARESGWAILVINADGSEQRRLLFHGQALAYPDWSPDGSQIAFHKHQSDEVVSVNVMDADGNNERRLTHTETYDTAPVWSPDGEQIAFTRDEDIWIMNADGSDQRLLMDDPVASNGADWSPDGSQIVFESGRHRNTEIYVMESDGSNLRRLTNNEAEDWWPTWSPDGSQIAFMSTLDGDWEIYVMDADGGNLRQLTENSVDDRGPAWSPDSTRIAFVSNRDTGLQNDTEIYVMNADGTDQQRIIEKSGFEWGVDWRPSSPIPTPIPPTPTADPHAEARAELGYAPVFEPAPCRFHKPPGFDLECGDLVIPEDRSQPDGAQVRLHVAIFRSRSEDPKPDPLIYLTGGGGGNELDTTVRYLDDGNDAILNERDFIMYNQRGAKYANPHLPCEGYAEFMAELAPMNLPREEAEAKEVEFLLACRDSFLDRGINLNMYNTAVNAADLDDLRIALDYDEINIYGTSYGTRLALEVLREYGEHIRSVIIDSVYPPNVHFYSDYWVNCWDTFKRIFDACEADPGCRERYPDIENTLYQVLDDLHANPRSMKYSGSGSEITLTYDDAVFVDTMYLFPYLSVPGMAPFVIQSASQGDFSPIESLIPWGMAVVPSDTIADVVQYSILCREETPFDSYERLVELGNLMPPQIARGSVFSFNYDLCAEWGVAPADAAEKEPVVSDVPTLILAGEFDPITPPLWARLAAETLSSSYYYEFPGLGHGIMRSNRCGFRIGNQFLEDPYTEPDASCISELPGIGFE